MSIPITVFNVPYDVPESGELQYGPTESALLALYGTVLNGLAGYTPGGVPQVVWPAATTVINPGTPVLTPTNIVHKISGNAAPVTLTSIADGATVGQLLVLLGSAPVNFITVPDGANTSLNGDCILSSGQALVLWWDGSDWQELGRRR